MANQDSELRPETDVLVVGAGPVGLSVGLQLAQASIDAQIVERRPSLSLHPKANGIFSRTMEVFRQWGIGERVAEVALPPEQCLGFAWLTRMNGIELGRIMFAQNVEELIDGHSCASPEIPRFAPQDRIERLLADEIGRSSSVGLQLGQQVVGIEQSDGYATVTVQGPDGLRRQVRARYVVAADGSRSSVKELMGLPEDAATPWGESVNIYFESEECDRLRAGRPYQLWWVINADVRGAFWPVSHAHRWIFTPEGVPGVDVSYYSPSVCADLIRRGAGVPVDLKIISATLWQQEMGILERWREGCVFFAGDAAHRFPPHGGFGMNSGIQDAQNLAWKLIATLKGTAGPGLLDSYEAERKPVAQSNAALTVRNAERVKETGWFTPNPAELDVIERAEGQGVRDRIAQAVSRQDASVHSLGQQFGTVYQSRAVLSDGTRAPPSSVADYRPSASPGARAPHLWIKSDLGTLSTLDLCEPAGLAMLVGEQGVMWREAAHTLPMPVPVYSVGTGAVDFHCDDFPMHYGIEKAGAVLLRPDGHVAWRAAKAPSNAAGDLRSAVRRILAWT